MKVEHEILIDAPADIVWRVTADVERWPEWTPTVTSVRKVGSGEFGIGSGALIKQPAQPESKWVVTSFETGRDFAWETRRPGLRMVGSHHLLSEGNITRNRLTVAASGALAVILWPLLKPVMRRALAAENEGLKKHCETIAAGHPKAEAG